MSQAILPNPLPYFERVSDPRRETKNKLHRLTAAVGWVEERNPAHRVVQYQPGRVGEMPSNRFIFDIDMTRHFAHRQ